MLNYLKFRSDPSNDHISDGEWAGQNNMQIEVLSAWKMEHPQELLSILEKRRGLYAGELIRIDQALLAKARSGDPRSIELVWSRFENWSPKIEEQNAKQGQGKKNKTLADLMGEL